MATNDFIINIVGDINEQETRRRIQEALARIVPNATINIQTTGTTQAVNDIDNVSRAIGTTAAVSVEAVRQIENVVKKLIDTTEQLDKSLTNIRIATTDTFENTLSIVKELSANGQELGATTAEMSSGVETWLRQGKTLEQAQALTEETIKFSKVSKKSAEDSAKYLTALSKAYGIVDDEISQITDKLTAIDSNAAINAGALAEGMSKTAVTAKQAGVSMDELAGMITTVTEITQQSANSIGNAFKTIFTRMSDIKSSKLQLIDDDGTTELLSDVELTLKNVGIDLRATVNEYNSYSDVLSELAAKWDSLTQVQQNALSKAFAGTRQAETFRVLMENYENVSKYAEIAADSAGSSAEKFNAYLDSVEAKTKSLQAAFEGLTLDIIDPQSIATVIDMTAKVTEFLDKTNLAKSALTGLAVGGAVSGLSSLAHVVGQAANSMSDFGNALRLASQGNLGTNEFSRLLNITNRLSASQLQAVLSTEALTDAERMQIITNTGLSEAEARTRLQTMGLSAAEGTATASTMSLSAAAKGLWATLAANPIGLIITAVTAGALAFNALKDAQEKAAEKAKEQAEQSRQNAESAKNEANELGELIEKYKELAESNTFDNAETRSQVKDIQSEITKLVGQQADNLDLVNGKLDDELSKLREIEQQQRDKLIRDQRTAYIDSTEEAKNTAYHKGSGYVDWVFDKNTVTFDGDNGKIREQITEIVNNAFEESGIDANISIVGHDFDKFLALSFADDATLRDRVNGIEAALQALENDTDFDTSSSELYRELSNAQKELQNVLDKQEQAANDLLETLTVNISVEGQTDIDSLESYKQYRQNIIDGLTKDDTISNAMSEGVLSTDRIETYVDSYLSGLDSISEYYNQWVSSFKPSDTIHHDVEAEVNKARAEFEKLPKLAMSEIFDFEDENGVKFSKTIKNYTDSMESLKKAYDSFKAGTFTDEDFAKLIQTFPELAGKADELDTAISELVSDMNGEMFVNFGDKFGRLDTSEDREQLLQYRDALISLSDFIKDKSGFDITDYSKQIDSITSAVSKLQSAYDKISDGSIKDSDILSLVEDFPELAPYIDDTERLQRELVKLAEVQPEKLIESLEELKETLTDKTQVSSIEKLISRLEKLSDITVKADTDTSQTAQKQIEKNIKLIETEIDKIKDKKQAQEDYVKQLEKEKSELEDIISKYKTAADTAITAIEDEISALEKRKSAIEDSYSAQIKVIDETYDKQKELVKSQQDSLDKQIQAIRDEAEEQDKLIRLKEKENALNKAKSTKQRVYTDHGFEIQSDSEAVAKAQKEYDDTLRDIENDNKIKSLESEKDRLQEEISRLDKERESKIALIEEQREKELQALSEQIQTMQDYKTAWTDTVNAYAKGQDDMTAAALLGSNWREDITNKDIGVLNTFSANYQGALSQLHDVIEPQITQAEAVVTAYDNEITKQNELKSTQEKYLDFYKTYSSEFAKATDEQREAVEKLNKAIQSNSESGLLSSLLQSAENSFNGDSNSLIDRLADNYNKNPSFYESILGGAKSLIGTASKNLADSITEMGKNILQNVKNDNRTSNVSNNWTFNNPVFDDSKNYEQFKAFANRFIGELNQEAQIGKK